MPIPTSRSFGTKQVMNGLQIVPNSDTPLSSTDTMVFQVVVCNDTGGAVTFSLLDRNATALKLFDAYSVGANTTVVFAFPEGVFMNNGISWSAGSANALHAEVFAFCEVDV